MGRIIKEETPEYRQDYFSNRVAGNAFEQLAKTLHDSGGKIWSKDEHKKLVDDTIRDDKIDYIDKLEEDKPDLHGYEPDTHSFAEWK